MFSETLQTTTTFLLNAQGERVLDEYGGPVTFHFDSPSGTRVDKTLAMSESAKFSPETYYSVGQAYGTPVLPIALVYPPISALPPVSADAVYPPISALPPVSAAAVLTPMSQAVSQNGVAATLSPIVSSAPNLLWIGLGVLGLVYLFGKRSGKRSVSA